MSLTKREQRIIHARDYLSAIPSSEPMARRVSEVLGYKLDKNKSNAFVAKVLRKLKKV